ncbi:MAG: citrate (Si)-synthase [Desulfobacterales bacterium]|nr:MAG: citrate (Si)-synthase [Desulfobacterales bacterium]
MPTLNTGLRGVKVATTRISDVKGDEGKLIYRGYLVADLAEQAGFEEVVHLLLYEKLPGGDELSRLKQVLAPEQAVPDAVFSALKLFPKTALPMDVLQAGIAQLAAFDPDVHEPENRDATLRMGLRLIARIPTLVAAWDRIRNERDPLPPLPGLSLAANFLYMLSGKIPDAELTRFFDTSLVLHAEHSLNASTFSARQVASTRAHVYTALAAAVGSLSGALHGGANTRVMRMLQEIGDPEKIDAYIEHQLSSGGKIMGMGHAVYKVDDPRALILAPMSRKMGERAGDTRWYEMSRILEKKAKAAFKTRKDVDIFVNVDFYSASLYHAMGIPVDLFTPVFAVSRVAGWVAHVLEEKYAEAAKTPALYRPGAEYIGDYCGPDECVFDPLKNR